MFTKLTDARSTVWQLIPALLAIAWIALGAHQANDDGFQYFLGVAEMTLLSAFALYVLFAVIVIGRYNRANPSAKLKLWQTYPSELLANDEMLESVTQRASKRVYVYNNIGLPLLILGVMYYHSNVITLAVLFAVYVAGYYLTYLRTIWPYLGKD